MEIDFLGLSSNKYTQHQDSSTDSFPDASCNGGVETSLSLSTTFDCQIKNENNKRKKKSELPVEKMINPSCSDRLSYYSPGGLSRSEQPGLALVSGPVFGSSSPAFLYDLTENLCSRNKAEDSSEPGSLRMIYRAEQILTTQSSRAAGDNAKYASAVGLPGDARIGTRGYTPTVAMARKATLARFLEKRLHRMNKARTTLVGKSLNCAIPHPEDCSSSTIINRSSNKKRHNSTIGL